VYEVLCGLILLLWNVLVIVVISRKVYEVFRRVDGHEAGIYVARKLIHVLAGGVTVILLPVLFTSPIVPLICSLILATIVYIPHRTGKLMYWFQIPGRLSEVYFAIMWGVIVTSLWYVDVRLAVLPIFFMSCGDGITGIVRHLVNGRRTKSWIGNLAMALLCVPVGYLMYGVLGAASGLVASIVEHFDKIDDNISIPLVSATVLVVPQIVTVL